MPSLRKPATPPTSLDGVSNTVPKRPRPSRITRSSTALLNTAHLDGTPIMPRTLTRSSESTGGLQDSLLETTAQGAASLPCSPNWAGAPWRTDDKTSDSPWSSRLSRSSWRCRPLTSTLLIAELVLPPGATLTSSVPSAPQLNYTETHSSHGQYQCGKTCIVISSPARPWTVLKVGCLRLNSLLRAFSPSTWYPSGCVPIIYPDSDPDPATTIYSRCSEWSHRLYNKNDTKKVQIYVIWKLILWAFIRASLFENSVCKLKVERNYFA